MDAIDYIFYRTAKFFYKKDGIDAISALLVLSLFQVSLFILTVRTILRIFFSSKEIANAPISSVTLGIFIAGAFLLFNYRRYKGQYWKLSERWRNGESRGQTRIRGWLTLLALLSPFILFILIIAATK